MGVALRFENIAKAYGKQGILKGLDLTVNEGEYFGLVGVNGAGKTTLIKCLLDFCDMDSGRIEIFGIDHKLNQARGRLAYLPERFVPPAFATGMDFLRYSGKLHGTAPSNARIEPILAVLDMNAEALGKSVRQLSKGMAQKLGLAASLLSGKDLLVWDEPMSGLDPKARALLKHHLLELRSRGHTFFFSTHLLADVHQLCDRMAVLHGGELRYVGSPGEFCTQFHASSMEEAYLRCVGASIP
jgi:ABC-2 type transport system ATP-binding protein